MKYLCINLPKATDRKAHCEEEFKKAGIDVKFVRAFHGRESHLKHESDWISCQVGACISHYMACEMVRQINTATVILEDDICLPEDFRHKLEEYLFDLDIASNYDWDVAAIGYFGGEQQPVFESINDHWQTLKSGDVWGQAAYVVNGASGAEAILNCITPIRSHIDRMFWECCRDGHMKGYFLKDNDFVKQRWDMPSQNV